MSIEELQALCAEWQERLRLQDWEIDLRITRGYDLGDNSGECTYFASKQQAIIKILDEGDWNPNRMGTQDQERTLVHELLHCRFVGSLPDETEGPAQILEEQAIHAVALALVKLKRERQDGDDSSSSTQREV